MDSGAARERIYDIFARREESLDTKVERALAVGTEALGLSLGFLTKIEAGTQEIVQSTGQHPLLQEGETCPLDDAYCRRTVEMEGILAVQDAAISGEVSDRAFESFGLGSYIGAKVIVGEEVYGTVCFADGDTRAEDFTEVDEFLVELIARFVGHAMERRSYERELDERREIYRAVIDASFDLVFRIGPDGRFTYVSHPIRELLGYDPEDFLEESFTEMLPDVETVELAQSLYEQVMAGETIEERYFPLKHAAGDRVFVDLRVTPIYEASVPPEERTAADVVGAQGMARDATRRYRHELLIRVLNRVLRHNLRNDMNVISGFAETLESRLEGQDAEMATRIVGKSNGLIKLSETARKLEENLDNPPEVERADVVPVVERVAAQIDERYPEAAVAVETPETALARTAPRLETALWELVDNAARHAGERPTIDLAVTREDKRVVIRVRDDGPGLPDQERAVLVSGEETPLVHGSGLGLWLVHWVVQSVDGTVDTCEADSGACVEIRLRADE